MRPASQHRQAQTEGTCPAKERICNNALEFKNEMSLSDGEEDSKVAASHKPLRDPTTSSPTTPRKTALPNPQIENLYPPTPSPTPIKTTKRPYSFLTTPTKSPKLLKRAYIPPQSPLRPTSVPEFSILYPQSLRTSALGISSLELKRASEAILRQVDWEAVEGYVASNRPGSVYRRIVRRVLQERIEELEEEEEEKEDEEEEGSAGSSFEWEEQVS